MPRTRLGPPPTSLRTIKYPQVTSLPRDEAPDKTVWSPQTCSKQPGNLTMLCRWGFSLFTDWILAIEALSKDDKQRCSSLKRFVQHLHDMTRANEVITAFCDSIASIAYIQDPKYHI